MIHGINQQMKHNSAQTVFDIIIYICDAAALLIQNLNQLM